MSYMNDREFEARLAQLVERLIRNNLRDNTFRGYGSVASGFERPARVPTAGAKLPPASEIATIDGVAAGGDLGGSYPNPTVEGLQGRAVGTAAPSSDQVLTWNGSAWAPADASGGLDEAGVASAGFTKELLMQDGVTAPPVPIETEAQDDWLYAD